jgi:hypothetical protein
VLLILLFRLQTHNIKKIISALSSYHKIALSQEFDESFLDAKAIAAGDSQEIMVSSTYSPLDASILQMCAFF